jgi:hypothetical protein
VQHPGKLFQTAAEQFVAGAGPGHDTRKEMMLP